MCVYVCVCVCVRVCVCVCTGSDKNPIAFIKKTILSKKQTKSHYE